MQGPSTTTEPNLILLPGLDGTGILFRPLLAALPEGIRPKIITYPSRERLSLGEHAELVAGQLPDGEVVILAESFSGLVALSLLAKQSLRARSLIFVGCFAEPPRPLLLAVARLVPRGGSLVHRTPDFALRQYCLGKHADAQQLALLREALAAVSPDVLAHRLELAGTRQPFFGSPFKVPCYYLQASQDRLVPAAAVGWFGEHFRRCEIASLEGPHFLLQAKPQECADWIAKKVRTALQSGADCLQCGD